MRKLSFLQRRVVEDRCPKMLKARTYKSVQLNAHLHLTTTKSLVTSTLHFASCVEDVRTPNTTKPFGKAPSHTNSAVAATPSAPFELNTLSSLLNTIVELKREAKLKSRPLIEVVTGVDCLFVHNVKRGAVVVHQCLREHIDRSLAKPSSSSATALVSNSPRLARVIVVLHKKCHNMFSVYRGVRVEFFEESFFRIRPHPMTRVPPSSFMTRTELRKRVGFVASNDWRPMTPTIFPHRWYSDVQSRYYGLEVGDVVKFHTHSGQLQLQMVYADEL